MKLGKNDIRKLRTYDPEDEGKKLSTGSAKSDNPENDRTYKVREHWKGLGVDELARLSRLPKGTIQWYWSTYMSGHHADEAVEELIRERRRKNRGGGKEMAKKYNLSYSSLRNFRHRNCPHSSWEKAAKELSNSLKAPTWGSVSRESGISRSTLQYFAQTHAPDADIADVPRLYREWRGIKTARDKCSEAGLNPQAVARYRSKHADQTMSDEEIIERILEWHERRGKTQGA